VNSFLYLGRNLTATNDDTLAVQTNIAKAKKKWAELRRILSCSAVKTNTFVRFYKAIVINVLLYGSEMWLVKGQTLDAMEAFHNKCVRTISGQPIRREVVDGEEVWIRPSIGPLLEKTKLKMLTKYIESRKTNLTASYKGKSTTDRCEIPSRSYIVKRKLFL
jgi:hypothetical protein